MGLAPQGHSPYVASALSRPYRIAIINVHYVSMFLSIVDIEHRCSFVASRPEAGPLVISRWQDRLPASNSDAVTRAISHTRDGGSFKLNVSVNATCPLVSLTGGRSHAHIHIHIQITGFKSVRVPPGNSQAIAGAGAGPGVLGGYSKTASRHPTAGTASRAAGLPGTTQ